MSIVEKAAEKLKALEPAASVPATAHARRGASPDARAPATRRTVPGDGTTCHVDIDALRRSGHYPCDRDAARRFADELRRVKRPLLNHLSATAGRSLKHAQRIMVASAVPGEGKTFTAINLAMSLAREPDFEVLLVDCDIPKANITRVLGLDDKPGIMDVLVHKDLQPRDVITRTDIPGLLVVPTGTRHALTAELFGGQRMEHVLKAWSEPQRQRLLVFDSSPLLATSEAQVLAAHVGQVVMVVAAGHTRRQELSVALQSFVDTQYIGLVLNKSRLPASESHYYGYYNAYYPEAGAGAGEA